LYEATPGGDMSLAGMSTARRRHLRPGRCRRAAHRGQLHEGLELRRNKPLIPVNHIEGHVSANYISNPDLKPPFLCLVVSGGHSHIVRVNDYGDYTLLGQTMDDAAGEAFDKAARVLTLPYPGGPRIDALAEEGDPHFLSLPHPHTPGKYDYSSPA